MSARTRASNGRAQPYQKESGRWECFVTVGVKPAGSLDRRKVSAKTRKECLDKVRRLEQLRRQGAVPEAGQRWTVASWLDHWLESIVGPTTKPKTAVSYETNVRLYLVPHLGGLRLDRLRPEHVDRMYADMKAASKGAATVQSTRRTLRAALNRAVDRGHIPSNPVTTAVKAAPRGAGSRAADARRGPAHPRSSSTRTERHRVDRPPQPRTPPR
jgi:hypothetical protein